MWTLAAYFLIFQIQYSRGYGILNYSPCNLQLTTAFETILITQCNKYCHDTKNWWILNTTEHASVRSSTWTECWLKCKNLIVGIFMPHGPITFPYYIDKCYTNVNFYICAHMVNGRTQLCEVCNESICIDGHSELGNISCTWCCVIQDWWIDAWSRTDESTRSILYHAINILPSPLPHTERFV